jgi:hypothetical protein
MNLRLIVYEIERVLTGKSPPFWKYANYVIAPGPILADFMYEILWDISKSTKQEHTVVIFFPGVLC